MNQAWAASSTPIVPTEKYTPRSRSSGTAVIAADGGAQQRRR